MGALRWLAARLPSAIRNELRRLHHAWLIRQGRFRSDEPEFDSVERFLTTGANAIDVGANVGHYTHRMAQCVGPTGRVFAFEPMPVTFATLASLAPHNVTLINAAASADFGEVSMGAPKWDDGGDNFYQAQIGKGDQRVFRLPLDCFVFPNISLIKIDAEGHDLQVLIGAQKLIERDRPAIIIEGGLDGPISTWLRERGYSITQAKNSPNVVATSLQ